MTQIARRLLSRLLAAVLCASLVTLCAASSAQSNDARFDREALDAMLAPVALYPDPLLSQVLMAATYPSEIEEAAQWSRARPGLTGDAAVRTSEGWDWDPSVRSLLAFPMVLDTMARNMRWTQDLGDAFLAQPEDVMDTVQQLRRRAYHNGTLRSTEYARVIDTGREIVIEPYSAQVAHVPHYDPRVVYGSWWWPARPPVYWARWPGYADLPGRAYVVHWGPGIGISSGFFFGGIVWPRREVRVVNVNAYYYTRRVVVDRHVEIQRQPQVRVAPARDAGPGTWRHDATRRRGPEFHEPQHARGTNAPFATPPANRAAEMRSDPAPPMGPRGMTAPARPPAVGPAVQLQRREPAPSNPRRETTANPPPATVSTPTQRRGERHDDTPRMPRSSERQATPPVAGNPQQQRRMERSTERDEQRPAEGRNRENDGPRARGPQEGARGAERTEPPGRASERGRAGANAGPGRGPQRAQDADRPG